MEVLIDISTIAGGCSSLGCFVFGIYCWLTQRVKDNRELEQRNHDVRVADQHSRKYL